MSNLHRALEKAEREKHSRLISTEPLFEVVEADPVPPKNDGPVLKDLATEIEKFDLPMREEESISLTPMGSFAAEQFRKLKTYIFRMNPHIPRVILVTSTMPQEGKTTITMNLAMSIAQEFNKRVIVMDADLRNPSIYPGKFANMKGLSEYLSNEALIAEISKRLDGEKLTVIPAGSPSHNAAELVGSKKMKDLIQTLRESNEETFIIIDSPPILSTSEPLMLSEWVDGVILVVMADQATRGSVKKAFSGLDQKKIIGVVFNNKNMKANKMYSEYYYSYRYYKKDNKQQQG